LSTRRKRFSREERLGSGKKWVATDSGPDVVRRYRKWFGVSTVCAILELRMLGVDVPDRRLEQARESERAQAALGARRRHRRAAPADDSDGEFAFIAGYTEGGAPFGIRRDEMEGKEDEGELPWD
jgi:hypothetical protein